MNTTFRYINLSVLLTSTANSEVAVLDLLKVFARINPSMLAELRQAFFLQDSLKLNAHAHTVKNSMLLLGAADIAEKINRMEIETRLNVYSFEKACFDSMMAELTEVSREVEAYISVLESKSDQASGLP